MSRQFAGDAVSPLWGQRRDLQVASPAAGKDWTFTFPGGYKYRLLLVTWQLATSAQVAERGASLQVKDGDGNVRLQVADTGNTAASKTAVVSVGRGLSSQASASGTAFTMAAPSVVFDAGWSMNSLTINLQTEDQLSAVRILWEELADPYPGFPTGVPERHHEDLSSVNDAYAHGHIA